VAPDVAPADLEETPRRELDALPRRARLGIGAKASPALQAAAVPDARRGRSSPAHQQVLARAVAMGDRADAHAADEAERAQALLALDETGEPDGIAGLEQDSRARSCWSRAGVAHKSGCDRRSICGPSWI